MSEQFKKDPWDAVSALDWEDAVGSVIAVDRFEEAGIVARADSREALHAIMTGRGISSNMYVTEAVPRIVESV